MLRFKTFGNLDAATAEKEINAWLMQAEPEVKSVQQSAGADGTLTVSFLFDAGFMANEQTMAAEVNAIVEHAQHEPVLEPITVNPEQMLPSPANPNS